jgi:hypothetical protein
MSHGQKVQFCVIESFFGRTFEIEDRLGGVSKHVLIQGERTNAVRASTLKLARRVAAIERAFAAAQAQAHPL